MKLAKSKGWISQRRALLQLTPELQTALRNGEIAIRTARSLAQVPPEEQVQAWNSERQRKHQDTEQDSAPTDNGHKPAVRVPVTAAKVTRIFRRLDADGLHALIQALTDRH
ncbi:hypothetical protein [Rhodococcus koreensis]|uniref:hypothetical protein n=1 Tax=Rhodococcus koreensis TaxID=99653 RepID=UPI003B845FC3